MRNFSKKVTVKVFLLNFQPLIIVLFGFFVLTEIQIESTAIITVGYGILLFILIVCELFYLLKAAPKGLGFVATPFSLIYLYYRIFFNTDLNKNIGISIFILLIPIRIYELIILNKKSSVDGVKHYNGIHASITPDLVMFINFFFQRP